MHFKTVVMTFLSNERRTPAHVVIIFHVRTCYGLNAERAHLYLTQYMDGVRFVILLLHL